MKKNGIASLIRWIARIELVICLVAGVIIGGSVPPTMLPGGGMEDQFGWGQALLFWIGGSIALIMLLGFAEIINLLQGIYNQNSKPAVSSEKIA